MRSVALLLVILTTAIYANDETTVELPGGAAMEFVWIEPGTFTMGTTEEQAQWLRDKGMWEDWYENELPAHPVTIREGFFLGRYEITQGQWESVMGTAPWSGQDYVESNPSHPAVYISWNNMQEFLGRLNEASGEEIYRLPTEAEWEYACRAGTSTLWSYGDDESQLGDYAWYGDNAWDAGLQYAQPVGMKLPNPWGLYDMHGNVYEWCQDWYREYSSDAQTDPPPLRSLPRVARGGAYGHTADGVRSAYRSFNGQTGRYPGFGARLLMMAPRPGRPTSVESESWGTIKRQTR